MAHSLALLAINLLYAMVWGFAGINKFLGGPPSWFAEKFGPTLLGRYPGVNTSFWILTSAELTVLAVAMIAFFRGEFLGRCRAPCLTLMLAMSLLVFVLLGFGLWLTQDFGGGFQQFVYFGVTLVALQYLQSAYQGRSPQS